MPVSNRPATQTRTTTQARTTTPATNPITGQPAEARPSATGWAPATGPASSPKTAFARSQYTESDAAAAQKAFKLPSLAAAKEFIGKKIIARQESKLQAKGITAGKYDGHETLDAFKRSGFSAADAKQAMKSFGLPNLDSAQKFIGMKVIGGDVETLQSAGITTDWADTHECRDAFDRSQYTEADAKTAKAKLSFLNDASIDAVKEYMGLKILQGTEEILRQVGVTTSKLDPHDCVVAFQKGGYTSAHVTAAKKAFPFLKTSTDAEVKAYIGLKVLNNFESVLADKGITPAAIKGRKPADQLKAFERSRYTEADAQQVLKRVPTLRTLDAAKKYVGLMVLQRTELVLRNWGVTPNPWDDHELTSAFERSGYTAKDVQQAKKALPFLSRSTEKEIQEYIGLKIVNDSEAILAEAGITPAHDAHE
ncbi:MAG: hypothetical protein JNG84_04020 [Archangium sp.]|nr:hypothetical protein [Archangium sp.]